MGFVPRGVARVRSVACVGRLQCRQIWTTSILPKAASCSVFTSSTLTPRGITFALVVAFTPITGAVRIPRNVNVACLEGISPFDFQEVPVYNGKQHTADGFPVTRAGTLI